LDDWSGAAALWLLSGVEFTFAFDESLGTGESLDVEVVLGVVLGVVSDVVLVGVAGAGVVSGATTGGGVGLALASVSELLRLQPTRIKGKLTDRRVIRNLFLVGFIDVLSLVRLNTGEWICFPTLSTLRGNGDSCHGVFAPYALVSVGDYLPIQKRPGGNSTGAAARPG
jgi:hypothetical protein